MLIDYVIQGFRIYSLKDFNVKQFVKQMTATQRTLKLEIIIIEDLVYVRNTRRYDTSNPYTKRK